MKKIDTVRALRDPEYRSSLSEAERAMLPAHPAGVSDVADEVLRSITGGCGGTDTNSCFITSANVYEMCPVSGP